jgi:hypothetical protein
MEAVETGQVLPGVHHLSNRGKVALMLERASIVLPYVLDA